MARLWSFWSALWHPETDLTSFANGIKSKLSRDTAHSSTGNPAVDVESSPGDILPFKTNFNELDDTMSRFLLGLCDWSKEIAREVYFTLCTLFTGQSDSLRYKRLKWHHFFKNICFKDNFESKNVYLPIDLIKAFDQGRDRNF